MFLVLVEYFIAEHQKKYLVYTMIILLFAYKKRMSPASKIAIQIGDTKETITFSKPSTLDLMS